MTGSDRIDELLHAWAAHRAGHRVGGHLSGNRGGAGCLSRPEAGAHRLAEIEAVDNIVRTMLSRRQMRLVVARYVRQLPSDRQIAIRLRLDRKYVGPAYDDVQEQIHKMLRLALPNTRDRHNMLTMGRQSNNLSLRLERCL